MNEWFGLMCAAAAFYALERSARAPRFHWPARYLIRTISRETAELFAASVILTAIYALLSSAAAGPYERRELAVLFFWPAAYMLAALGRRPQSFFMALLCACTACVPLKSGGWAVVQTVYALAGFALSVGLFRLAAAGLEARVIFSPVPRPFRGLPILLILIFFVSLCGWGVAAGWPFIF